MSPHWTQPWKIRRSVKVLSFAVRQNWYLLNTGGEPCFLLKRMRRANASFQFDGRQVDYINSDLLTYTTDPDVGYFRNLLWSESSDDAKVYPDIGTLTCTVEVSGSATVWEAAVDKYSFVAGRPEYAFDIYQNQLDSNGVKLDDAVYIVFNTPPFSSSAIAHLQYGNTNPETQFENMQPILDSNPTYQNTLFSYEQWIKTDSIIRSRYVPNRFLVAFPGTLDDINLTEGGLLKLSSADHWTVPPPYCPKIEEHDVIIRESTGQRFQVTGTTPIYVEDILVSQHFTLSELSPDSSVFNVEVDK